MIFPLNSAAPEGPWKNWIVSNLLSKILLSRFFMKIMKVVFSSFNDFVVCQLTRLRIFFFFKSKLKRKDKRQMCSWSLTRLWLSFDVFPCGLSMKCARILLPHGQPSGYAQNTTVSPTFCFLDEGWLWHLMQAPCSQVTFYHDPGDWFTNCHLGENDLIASSESARTSG